MVSTYFSVPLDTVGDGSGLTNLNVDGLPVPIPFLVTAPAGMSVFLGGLSIRLYDDAPGQADPDASLFGHLPELANGLLLELVISGETVPYQPITTNGGLAALGGSLSAIGNHWFSSVQFAEVPMTPGDIIRCTVRDDLSGLDSLRINALGRVVRSRGMTAWPPAA